MDFVSELRDDYTTDAAFSAMKEAIKASEGHEVVSPGFVRPGWTPVQLADLCTTHNMLYHNLDWHEYIEMARTLLMEGATPTGPFEERLAVAKALLSHNPSTLPGIFAEIRRLIVSAPHIGDLYTAMAALRLRVFQPDLALSLLELAESCPTHLPSLRTLVHAKATWMRQSWLKKVHDSVVVGVALKDASVYENIKMMLTTVDYDKVDPLVAKLRIDPSRLFSIWQRSSAFAHFVYEAEIGLSRGQALLLRPLRSSQANSSPILQLSQVVYDQILTYLDLKSAKEMLSTCRELYTRTRVESTAWLHYAHTEMGIEPSSIPQYWIDDMAAVMMNVRSMVKLIQAFETLDMADSASQQRVLDIWIGQNSMEVVSQTPSGAELMELASIAFLTRLLSLLTIDAPIGALATYFVSSGADVVGALLNVMRMRLRVVYDSCLYHQLISLLVLSKSPMAEKWNKRLIDGGLETICRHQIERNEMEGVNASLLIASLHSRQWVNMKYLDCTMFSQIGDVATKLSPQAKSTHTVDLEESENSVEEQEEAVSTSTVSTNRSMSDGTRHREEEQWRLNPMERMSGFWRISLVPSTHADFEKIDLGFFDLSFEETPVDRDSDEGMGGQNFDILQSPTLRVRGPGLLSSKVPPSFAPTNLSSDIDGFFDALSLKLTFNIESDNDSLFCSAIAFPLGFGGYFGRLNGPAGEERSHSPTVKVLGSFIMWRDVRPFSPESSKYPLGEEIEKVRDWYDFEGDHYRAGKSELANSVNNLPASTPVPFFTLVKRRPHMWLMVNTYSMLVWKLSLWESADYATLHSMDGSEVAAPSFQIASMATMLKQRPEFESDEVYALRLRSFETASSSLYYARLALTLSYTMAEVMADLAVVQHAMRVVYPKCSPLLLEDSAAFDNLESISPGKRISLAGDPERFAPAYDALMRRIEKTSNAFSKHQHRFRRACATILDLAFDPSTYDGEKEGDGVSYARKVKSVWEKWRRRWSQTHPSLFSTSAPSLLDRPCSIDEIQLLLSHAAFESSAKGEILYTDDHSDSSSDEEDRPFIKPRSSMSSTSTASTATSPSSSLSEASRSNSGSDSPQSLSSPSDSPETSPKNSHERLVRDGFPETLKDHDSDVDHKKTSIVNIGVPIATTAVVIATTMSIGAYFVARWLFKSRSD